MLRGGVGGIFTVKIPTFSGKTAENVMGVYGIDCPAIFWDRECTTFWGGGRGCAGALTRPSTRHLPPKNFDYVSRVLGVFLKKGKSSEFNSRHDGGIFGWPTPPHCFKKAKTVGGRNGKPI